MEFEAKQAMGRADSTHHQVVNDTQMAAQTQINQLMEEVRKLNIKLGENETEKHNVVKETKIKVIKICSKYPIYTEAF